LRLARADRFQELWQLLVNAAKTSVGKNRDHIARAQLRRNQLHDCVDGGNYPRPAAMLLDLRSHRGQIQALGFRNRFRLEDVGDDRGSRIAHKRAPG
jgi:hypothetical protein